MFEQATATSCVFRPLTLPVVLACLLLPALAPAQNEQVLRDFFEGQVVLVKIEMPATKKGVDIHPGEEEVLDRDELIARLRSRGVAIDVGERAVVTKVKVKGRHIEFQLDGGGRSAYRSRSYRSRSYASPAPVHRSGAEKAREIQLEGQLAAADPAERDEIHRTLETVRSEPRRRRTGGSATTTTISTSGAYGGSRFNIRYRGEVPAEALTPEGLLEALSGFVEHPAPRKFPAEPEQAR